jgi:ribosomal protein S18 acetylase RimI-like enzyme
MTRKQEREWPCPTCEARVTTTVWSSLNVTLNPESKADLFKGEINLFRCPSCGFEGPLPVPFLYHDMDNGVMVWYFPADRLEDGSFYNLFTGDGQFHLPINDVSGASPFAQMLSMFMGDSHVVFSMEELARYVTFRDRLRESNTKDKGRAPLSHLSEQLRSMPHWLREWAEHQAAAGRAAPPPLTARLDGYHVYEASKDDWPWLTDVLVERLWERLGPLAAGVEQDHRTIMEKMGLPIDEDFVDEYLSPEAARRFVWATVTLQNARIRGPDGYPSALYLARDADLEKVGYVWVGHTRAEGTLEPQALILDLYVVEAHRRKGLGTLLMGVAEQWAGQRGLTRVVLDFEPDDAPARGLYEKLGYELHTIRMTKSVIGDDVP